QVATARFILPCVENTLADSEEAVVSSGLRCLSSLVRLGLIPRHALHGQARSATPLLHHPGLWVRLGTASLCLAVARALGPLDVHVFLHPILRPHLRYSLAGSELEEDTLFDALRSPVKRETFQFAVSEVCERRRARSAMNTMASGPVGGTGSGMKNGTGGTVAEALFQRNPGHNNNDNNNEEEEEDHRYVHPASVHGAESRTQATEASMIGGEGRLKRVLSLGSSIDSERQHREEGIGVRVRGGNGRGQGSIEGGTDGRRLRGVSSSGVICTSGKPGPVDCTIVEGGGEQAGSGGGRISLEEREKLVLMKGHIESAAQHVVNKLAGRGGDG
ncbi:unnamed protein product, partial [Choristocarpus tenellus]